MKDVFDLEGRVAVVTGACGLLGRRHASALAARGALVVATDVDDEACASLADDLGLAFGVAADVTNRESLERVRERVMASFDRLDILVNNAAIDDKVERPDASVDASRFEHYPLERFRRALDVNVTGVFLTSQVLVPMMMRRGAGSVINVASTYALVGPDPALYRTPDGEQAFHKSPAYPTTKGAVIAFTRYLAAYLGRSGVRANALCPGGVENGQPAWFVDNYEARTPLGRMASPNDYEGALVFLASDASSYMTGATLVVDGGFTAW